jgi:hypothetical protein
VECAKRKHILLGDYFLYIHYVALEITDNVTFGCADITTQRCLLLYKEKLSICPGLFADARTVITDYRSCCSKAPWIYLHMHKKFQASTAALLNLQKAFQLAKNIITGNYTC